MLLPEISTCHQRCCRVYPKEVETEIDAIPGVNESALIAEHLYFDLVSTFWFKPPVFDKGKHCVFYHRYHVVWSTKYRFKVLRGDIQKRIREIIRRVCAENGVDIIKGVVSSDHVHIFVSIPPKLSMSDFTRKVKGRSSFLIQREFPALKKRYWGQRFWGRGYFSTTNGVITEDVVLQYLNTHIKNPTGASR